MLKTNLTDIYDTYIWRQCTVFCECDEQMLGKWRKFRFSFTYGLYVASGVPRNFFRGGGGKVQEIQLRTEGRENGDLRAIAP
jgi:hypothetical protein